MISAFFLALGIVGLFLALFGVPLAHDGNLVVAGIAFLVAAIVAWVCGSSFRKALVRERAGMVAPRRSPLWMVLGVTLFVLGGAAAGFVMQEAQRQLREDRQPAGERIQAAIAATLEKKVGAEQRLAAFHDQPKKLRSRTKEIADQVLEMDLSEKVQQNDDRLREQYHELEWIENAPTRLRICWFGGLAFGLGCVAVLLMSFFRSTKPQAPTTPSEQATVPFLG
jgi:hypothetical protein